MAGTPTPTPSPEAQQELGELLQEREHFLGTIYRYARIATYVIAAIVAALLIQWGALG